MNRPTVPAPQPWTFPAPREARLDNGLRILALHRPGQHLINATVVLEHPLTAEPRGLEGVSALVQRTLDEGTLRHPGTDFADELESCGGVLTGGSTHTAVHVGLEVPSTRFAEALPLLAEALVQPELSDDDVQRHVELRLAEIAQQNAHPGHRGARAFREAVTGAKFRAARPVSGTAGTVATVTAEDVREHHARHYVPARATLVLAGDLAGDPLPLVRAAFDQWQGADAPVTHETPAGATGGTLLLHRPGSVQADVRIGRFGMDRLNPEWPALRLGTFVLGGGFLSRLNRVLREERGFTYGVHLTNTPARSGGMLTMHASFRTEVAADAIAEAYELFRVDGERAITTDELTASVNYLVGVMPLRCATAGGIADQVTTLVDAGLDTDYVNRHTAALAGVTPSEADEAVARTLRRDDLTLVVVGDAEVLADRLAGRGIHPEVVTDE